MAYEFADFYDKKAKEIKEQPPLRKVMTGVLLALLVIPMIAWTGGEMLFRENK